MCMIILVSGRLEAAVPGVKATPGRADGCGFVADGVSLAVYSTQTAGVTPGTEKADYAAIIQLVPANADRRDDRGRAAQIF